MHIGKPVFQTKDLNSASQQLDEAASLINSVINFSTATHCGEELDWNQVYDRLREYAWAARQIDATGSLVVHLVSNVPYLVKTPKTNNVFNGEIKTVIIPVHHSIRMGTAACGKVRGRPYEWPQGNYQALTRAQVDCDACREVIKNDGRSD